jgi:hypothetical protein
VQRHRERETDRQRDLSPFVFVTGKKFISFFVLEGESNGERGVSVQYTAPVEVHTPWDRRLGRNPQLLCRKEITKESGERGIPLHILLQLKYNHGTQRV